MCKDMPLERGCHCSSAQAYGSLAIVVDLCWGGLWVAAGACLSEEIVVYGREGTLFAVPGADPDFWRRYKVACIFAWLAW